MAPATSASTAAKAWGAVNNHSDLLTENQHVTKIQMKLKMAPTINASTRINEIYAAVGKVYAACPACKSNHGFQVFETSIPVMESYSAVPLPRGADAPYQPKARAIVIVICGACGHISHYDQAHLGVLGTAPAEVRNLEIHEN